MHLIQRLVALRPFLSGMSVLGAARSLLGLSTLITLLFNKPYILFGWNTGTSVPAVPEKSLIFYWMEYGFPGSSTLLASIILLSVVVGIWPRATCFLHWWLCWSIMNAGIAIEGGDQINHIVSLLMIPLCWTHLDKFWHFQPKIVVRSFGARFSSSCILMIKLQVSVIYLHAFVGKLFVKEWSNGTAAYYYLLDPVFGVSGPIQMLVEPVLLSSLGVVVFTWGALLIEILLFLAIGWSSSWKNRIFFVGLSFHLAIGFVHGLWSFGLTMTAVLMVYLLVRVPSTHFFAARNENFAAVKDLYPHPVLGPER